MDAGRSARTPDGKNGGGDRWGVRKVINPALFQCTGRANTLPDQSDQNGGTTTANSSGVFTFSYTGTTLPQGSYGFTASATVGGKVSPQSPVFQATVDLTAPTVTLTAPATTVDRTPQIAVTATDNVGIPATATVTLDVDLNNDGNFTDTGETGYQTATMTNGVALFTLSP